MPERAGVSPIRYGEMSAGSAKKSTANSRGGESIQHHKPPLSVIKLTGTDLVLCKGSNLTFCRLPSRHSGLDCQTSEGSLTRLTTERNDSCSPCCPLCLLKY